MVSSAISAVPLVPLLLALKLDLDGFRAVVGGGNFFEPGVLEGLLGGDAVVGVVDEDAVEEVEEVGAELVVAGDNVLVGGVSWLLVVGNGADGIYL